MATIGEILPYMDVSRQSSRQVFKPIKDLGYLMEDILVGIGSFLPNRGVDISHDDVKWAQFFYERKSKYSVLKNVQFRIREFPESEELDQAYSNLVATGVLFWGGMAVHPLHQFSPACKICFESYSKKLFNNKELAELQKLSLEFQERFVQSS